MEAETVEERIEREVAAATRTIHRRQARDYLFQISSRLKSIQTLLEDDPAPIYLPVTAIVQSIDRLTGQIDTLIVEGDK